MCSVEAHIFKLLLPGLLTEDEIRKEFKVRSVKIKGVEKKSKPDLVELYLQYFMPLPQRTFPGTHHGKLLNQMILKESLARRKNMKSEDTKSSVQYGFEDSSTRRSGSTVLGKRSASGRDRLKPPIEHSQVTSKKLSLTSHSSSDCSLDSVAVKDRSRDRHDSKEEKKNRSDGESKTDDIKLRRRSTSSSESKSDDSSPSKKARQRIQWP